MVAIKLWKKKNKQKHKFYDSIATSISHSSTSRNSSGQILNRCETYSKIILARYQLETKDKFLSFS